MSDPSFQSGSNPGLKNVQLQLGMNSPHGPHLNGRHDMTQGQAMPPPFYNNVSVNGPSQGVSIGNMMPSSRPQQMRPPTASQQRYSAPPMGVAQPSSRFTGPPPPQQQMMGQSGPTQTMTGARPAMSTHSGPPGPPQMNVSADGRGITLPPRMTGPPASLASNITNRQMLNTGPPQSRSGVLPRQTVPGVHPSSMGSQATTMGGPPSSIGPPTTSMGHGPPAPPRSIGAPPMNTGGPPISMHGPSTSMGALPTQSRPPIGPPPTANEMKTSSTHENQPAGMHDELPAPYHGHGTYTHSIRPLSDSPRGLTPTHSESPSRKSSRAPSPISSQQIDAIEGQFAPGSQQPPLLGQGQSLAPPSVSQMTGQSSSGGVTGRRVYPEMTINQQVSTSSMPNNPTQPPGGDTGQLGMPPQYVSTSQAPGLSQLPGQGRMYGPPPPSDQRANYGPSPALGKGQGSTQSFGPPPGLPVSGQTTNYTSTQPVTGQGVNYGQPMMSQGTDYGQPGLVGQSVQQAAPSSGNYNQPNQQFNANFGNLGIQDTNRPINLLQEKKLIPDTGVETPRPQLESEYKKVNTSPEIFRCTLNKIPQSQSLLNKARLPLGIILHPFKDLSQLPVIQSSVIVRCRSCRTYINPFVYFVDQRRWKCNLCFRVNDLPEEFLFDPVTKTYGEPHRRPEIKSGTIEFIAPSEYMLRPPQPAVYLFILDVSFNAIETGYLQVFCQTLLDELDRIPGDARTLMGFITFDKALHYYNLSEGLSQPHMMVAPDIEEIYLPAYDGLLVNMKENREMIIDLLTRLPQMFEGNMETGSALGPALQAALKMMNATGGRITVMQTVLPSEGPGSLKSREDPNQRSAKNVPNMGPATDFYKKMALDCSAQQIAVDIFVLNGQYVDLSSIGCVAKYSGGSINYYSQFHTVQNPEESDRYEYDLRRYLTRKIGFESVMRVRCTKGLSIHTFHGNFFVRSTDLLSLPNVNPDAGFAMQVSIEDNLQDSANVCFQCALLYTSSKGERRIRVHTLCVPVTNQLSEVFMGADQQAITSLLAKMAVDRSLSSTLGHAREAMINACTDAFRAFGGTLPTSQRIGTLPICHSLRLLPVYVVAMLKFMAFRVGVSTKLDDRVFAMEQCKNLPLSFLILKMYPDLYPVHELTEEGGIHREDGVIPQPPLLQLTAAQINRTGAYIMDAADSLYLYVGSAVSTQFLQGIFNTGDYGQLVEGMTELPELENPTSELLRNFLVYLLEQRPFHAKVVLVRDDGRQRVEFMRHMIEDRTESSMSYYEFLQHLQKQIQN